MVGPANDFIGLINKINKTRGTERADAVYSLAQMTNLKPFQEEIRIKRFRKLLGDKSAEVTIQAVRGLGIRGKESTLLRPIIRLLSKTTDSFVAKETRKALASIEHRTVGDKGKDGESVLRPAIRAMAETEKESELCADVLAIALVRIEKLSRPPSP